MRVVALVSGMLIGGVVWAAEPADGGSSASARPPPPPSEAASKESFPLVPWAAPGGPDAAIGPPPAVFEGTWPHLHEPPFVLPRRRTPDWLSWAVRDSATIPIRGPGPPEPYTPPPEPAITALTLPVAPPAPEPLKRNELIVWGNRLEKARELLAEKLQSMGYAEQRRGDGYTVWAPAEREDRWRPRVTVYDDGWYLVKSSAVSGGAPQITGAPGVPGHGGSIAPSFDRAPAVPGMGMGFAFSSRRQRQAAEARVARQIHTFVEGIREAQADGLLLARLDALPGELDVIWYGGRAPDGSRLASTDDRKRALLSMWASRTPTRGGETVRQAIADYLLGQVDPESPLSRALVAEAEAVCGCAFPWPGSGRAPR